MPLTTVTPNLGLFVGVLAVMLLVLLLLQGLHRPPTRPCPNCGNPVRIFVRQCKHCGYQFVWFRFSR